MTEPDTRSGPTGPGRDEAGCSWCGEPPGPGPCNCVEWCGHADCGAEQPLNPRWRDYHTLPDEWLINKLRPFLRRHKRIHKPIARYALRHLHCLLDGQCVFRGGHRGPCYWGNEDDDDV